MRRRRQQEPDTRLDWRDPDMPVLRAVEYSNFGIGIEVKLESFSPEEEQRHAKEMLDYAMKNPKAPRWIDDPSYNWKRPGARRRRL